MKVLNRKFEYSVNASAAVVRWNYWDHEHLTVIHDSYTEAHVLHETDNFVLFLLRWKVPIFSFIQSSGLGCMVAEEEYTFKDYQLTYFGIPSFTTITIVPKDDDNCVIQTDYKFILKGWRKILAPVMHKMMGKWMDKVWMEDLPLKLRRHKALRWGFKDFVGFPKTVSQRLTEGEMSQRLPVIRHKDCDLDHYKNLVKD